MIASEPAAGTTGRGRLVRAVVVVSFGAAVWFILGDADRRASVGDIGLVGMATILALTTTGSLLISGSWATVAAAHTGWRDAFVEYVIYQPAKYLPGGVAQGLLQMSHVRAAVGSWRKSSGVLIVHSLVLVAGGGLAAAPALIARFGVLIVAGGVLLFVTIGVATAKLSRQFELASNVVPRFSGLVVAVLMAGLGLVAWGGAFAGALASITDGNLLAMDISAFSTGWLAGFAAVPIPAGIGVREAVLVGLSSHPGASVITGSIVVRLAAATCESVLAVIALAIAHRET